jgi:hypothetical protein
MSQHQYTKVTRQGWGSRIVESIKGIATGAILVLVAFPLLFWNEGRAVQTAKSLKEGAAAVVTVSVDSVDNAHDGQLVHLTGEANADGALSDDLLGVQVEGALKLRRIVEMYQWQQREERDTQRNVGGSEETVTTYTYEQVWSDGLIDSSRFEKSAQYTNPSQLPFESQEHVADPIRLGAFTLGEPLVAQLRTYQAHRLSEQAITPATSITSDNRPLQVHDGVAYLAQSPTSPSIGDIRIRYETVSPHAASVIARQAGDRLERYQTQAGDGLAMVKAGAHDADTMFAEAAKANQTLTWILRGAGFFVMALGFGLVFRPLAVVADVLPILGDMLRLGTGVISGVLAFGLSMITISIAWIYYRPLIGIPLLLVGVGGIVYMKVFAAKRKKAAGAAPPAA